MLSLRCTLLRDTFDGGAPDNPAVAEWPPSPMRLFSALVAVADHTSTGDTDALRALERLPPPEIYGAPAIVSGGYRRAFVPTNAVRQGGGSTTYPGRTNAERGWARAIPSSPRLWYHWPAAEIDPAARERLAELCRRVPYLGRSTSPAMIEMSDDAPDETLQRWIPGDTVDARQFQFQQTIRSPYDGALAALQEAHEAKYLRGEPGDPWEIGRPVDYGNVRPVPVEGGPATGPYQDVVLFRLDGPRLDGRHTARFAAYTRRALMERLGGEDLPVLHGHHDGSVVQCAVLPLPFVGAPYADGHLLGVALALPALDQDERRAMHRALPASGEAMRVLAGPLGAVDLERLAPLDTTGTTGDRAWGLNPERWTRPARTWITALPAVMDRYLKRRDDVAAEVRRMLVRSGYPEPVEVDVSRYPMLDGAPDLRPEDTVRRAGERGFKPYRHVRLRFEQPVRGPVVFGSMRHYGLGICVPVTGGGGS